MQAAPGKSLVGKVVDKDDQVTIHTDFKLEGGVVVYKQGEKMIDFFFKSMFQEFLKVLNISESLCINANALIAGKLASIKPLLTEQ